MHQVTRRSLPRPLRRFILAFILKFFTLLQTVVNRVRFVLRGSVHRGDYERIRTCVKELGERLVSALVQLITHISTDVVQRPSWNDNMVPRADVVLVLSFRDRLCGTRHKVEMLIHGMRLLSNFPTDRDGHDDHLRVFMSVGM